MDPGKDIQSVDAEVHGENDNQASTGKFFFCVCV